MAYPPTGHEADDFDNDAATTRQHQIKMLNLSGGLTQNTGPFWLLNNDPALLMASNEAWLLIGMWD